MKVIDLLNKIANGEEVKEFYMYDKLWQFDKKANEFHTNERHKLKMGFLLDELNEEIEIIEESKKIEKIKTKLFANDGIFINNNEINVKKINAVEDHIIRKLNEIIDYINSKENK